jgi:hypothetical protein
MDRLGSAPVYPATLGVHWPRVHDPSAVSATTSLSERWLEHARRWATMPQTNMERSAIAIPSVEDHVGCGC